MQEPPSPPVGRRPPARRSAPRRGSGGQRGRPRAGRATRAGGARLGATLSREARSVRPEARGRAELRRDGCRHRRAHSHAQDARVPRAGSAVAGFGGVPMNAIDPRIHQALDGELAPEALPPELRRAVARLEAAAALLAAPVPAAGLDVRVMTALRRAPSPRARRLVRWLVAPHSLTLRVRPPRSLALAAAVALVTPFPLRDGRPLLHEHEGIPQIVAQLPRARSLH